MDLSSALAVEATVAEHDFIQIVQSGPGWVFGAILFSAFVALISLAASIATQRIIAKKRAAYDFMSHARGDTKFLNEEQTFLDLIENDKLLDIVDAKTKRANSDRLDVKNYLNQFELLCVSIEHHIVDENVCKAMWGDVLVDRWESAQELIAEIRKKAGEKVGKDSDDEILEAFEIVAKRWKENPHVEELNIFIRMFRELFKL